MDEEKKKYRFKNPVAWGGRRERGEILELTVTDAEALGDDVELVIEPKEAPEATTVTPEADSEPKGDYAPVLTPEEEAAKAAKPATDAEAEKPKAEEAPATETHKGRKK